MWHDDAWERLMTLKSDCTEGTPMVCYILQAMKNSLSMNSQITLTSDEFQSKTWSRMPGDQMETNESGWEDRAKVLKSNGNAVLIAGEDVLIAVGICHVMPMIIIETVGDEKCSYPFIRTRPTLSHQSMKLEERETFVFVQTEVRLLWSVCRNRSESIGEADWLVDTRLGQIRWDRVARSWLDIVLCVVHRRYLLWFANL